MSEKSTVHENPIEKLGSLMKDVRFAMLATVDRKGRLRSRPMALQSGSFDGTLWFFTSDDSPKSDEVRTEHQVNVSFSDPRHQLYVSVSGIADIVHDREKARELWSPLHKAWFPQGLDDPHLALLRVRVTQAEYWDSPSGKVVQLAGFLKSIATGRPAQGIGENRKLKLTG